MKRSEINAILQEGDEFFKSRMWFLPEWAYWSADQWRQFRHQCSAVFAHSLGWDITDFGSGNFLKRGLFLFTLRNGITGQSGKQYAEKIMIVKEEQETPFHYHKFKQEDIINRGGGNLLFNLYHAGDGKTLDEKRPVEILIDDRAFTVNPGETLSLKPGQSLCLDPMVYHRFYGEKGSGTVLVGEVSLVNDDSTDNYFYETLGRFPEIEEDEDPLYLLSCDYAGFLGV
ncbi:D-lyxose/D-mannose family sugar isomerase [Marispirochaeta sp.]|jgi:D-lyxose ketol-isomerase|uniref:D-lyxose/D-mannose family sugar isomerase n=1 Tax=Marispirochaeta sp. TaxID=2038653 RepID=UPI0029C98578|nr:D-lyxose/D-mannose family sugar isomerase [Marispirochaeta sp.]